MPIYMIVLTYDCVHTQLIVPKYHCDQTRFCPYMIMLNRLCPSLIVVTYNWADTRICQDKIIIVPINKFTCNFVPTIVPRRDCTLTITVLSRQLDHDQLKLRPCFLPWVSKNRRYRILKGIDRLADFFLYYWT